MIAISIKGGLIPAMLAVAMLSRAQDPVSPPPATAKPESLRVYVVRFQDSGTARDSTTTPTPNSANQGCQCSPPEQQRGDTKPELPSNSVNPRDLAQLT